MRLSDSSTMKGSALQRRQVQSKPQFFRRWACLSFRGWIGLRVRVSCRDLSLARHTARVAAYSV